MLYDGDAQSLGAVLEAFPQYGKLKQLVKIPLAEYHLLTAYLKMKNGNMNGENPELAAKVLEKVRKLNGE